MVLIHNDYSVAQMGNLRGRFGRAGNMPVGRQQLQQSRILAQQGRIADGDSQFVFMAAPAGVQQSLQGLQAIRCVESEVAEILVVDVDLLRSERQQAVECRCVGSPVGDQFAGHGA